MLDAANKAQIEFDEHLFNLQIKPLIDEWDDNDDVELPTSWATIYVNEDGVEVSLDTVTLYVRRIRQYAKKIDEICRCVWTDCGGSETPEFVADELRPRVLAGIEERARATRHRWSTLPFRGDFGYKNALIRFEPELVKVVEEIERVSEVEVVRLSHRLGANIKEHCCPGKLSG